MGSLKLLITRTNDFFSFVSRIDFIQKRNIGIQYWWCVRLSLFHKLWMGLKGKEKMEEPVVPRCCPGTQRDIKHNSPEVPVPGLMASHSPRDNN